MERSVKLLIAVLTILISTNLLSAEKASKGDLLEAFDGKFILVEGQSKQACFSILGNSINIIHQKGKCDQYIDISISRRGALCLEDKKKERCAKVRILSNGDFAWGKSRRPITIFDSHSQLTGGASEVDIKGESKLAREYYRNADKLQKRGELWQAVIEFKKSAELGYAKAQFSLAQALQKGKGIDKNIEEATEWYKKAADQGLDRAQSGLAKILLKYGNDDKSAVELLEVAASGGHAKSQVKLGKLYDSGKATGWGKPKIAFKWFKLAADQGDKEGQYRVCKAYYSGHGVNRNRSEAKKWCTRSAGQGYSRAEKILRKIDNF
jgi:tetratricopeptide (TPR) repeat protein